MAAQSRTPAQADSVLFFYEPFTEKQIGDARICLDLNHIARTVQGLCGVLRVLEANVIAADSDTGRAFPAYIDGHLHSAAIALADQALYCTEQLGERLGARRVNHE